MSDGYAEALSRAQSYSATLAGPSLFDRLARLGPKGRTAVINSLSPSEITMLAHAWEAWARPKQNPALVDHRILLWLAGRAFGKSMSAAQRVRCRVDGGARSIGLIGPTADDVERYMLGVHETREGLLNIFPKHQQPEYIKRDGIVRFHTGAVGYVNSAERPELRGPNLDTVWCDELAKWRYLMTLWSNIELATRAMMALPIEIIVTTTPLPMRFLRELVADPDCVTIIGTSKENEANVADGWWERQQRRLGGTRLGRQELEGEILGDNPDALFQSSILDKCRVETEPRDLRKVVAVDPAIATGKDNDPTGILVAGDDVDGHIYVVEDLTGKHKPDVWGKLVVDAYDQHHAEAVIGERNRGGDLVEANVRAAMQRKRGGIAAAALKFVNVQAVRGKAVRAEPVSALHERGMIHIVGNDKVDLEQELTEWNPKAGGASPNRLDALVWGVWYLGNLGDAQKADGRAGFVGLEKVTAAISSSQQRPQGQRQPTARPPWDRWGGRRL